MHVGVVESGKGDAARWLRRFAAVYADALDIPLHPGSLNVRLDNSFDWSAPELGDWTVRLDLRPHGGEREVVMIPCVLPDLDGTPGWLWTTTVTASRPPSPLVEIVAPVHLRERFGLVDGSRLRVAHPPWTGELAPPRRIETDRLVLRPKVAADAPLLADAVDSSLEHLRAWMPWAMDEPSSATDRLARIERHGTAFEEGRDFTYGLYAPDESEMVGSAGLHPREITDGLEIGYWVRADQVGKGLATEAVSALIRVAFDLPWVRRIRICCDPENHASRRIPEKLGFTLLEIRRADAVTPAGRPRDTAVFELRRDRSKTGT